MVAAERFCEVLRSYAISESRVLGTASIRVGCNAAVFYLTIDVKSFFLKHKFKNNFFPVFFETVIVTQVVSNVKNILI